MIKIYSIREVKDERWWGEQLKRIGVLFILIYIGAVGLNIIWDAKAKAREAASNPVPIITYEEYRALAEECYE